MEFTPMTDEEIKFSKLIPEGAYHFETLEAEDAISKKGDSQIKVNQKIWNDEKKIWYRSDWLTAKMIHKLKHYCELREDLKEAYEAGKVQASKCVGTKGMLVIRHQQQKDGPYAGEWKDSISDYLVPEVQEFNDDVTF